MGSSVVGVVVVDPPPVACRSRCSYSAAKVAVILPAVIGYVLPVWSVIDVAVAISAGSCSVYVPASGTSCMTSIVAPGLLVSMSFALGQ